MNKFFKQNSFFIILGFFAILSAAFLLNENSKIKDNSSFVFNQNSKITTEVIIEEDEYETTDFRLISDISEAIKDLFSIEN